MTHIKFIAKIVGFAILAIVVMSAVNIVLTPKYMYDNEWPTTQTFSDFYKMDRDTVDVLFLGSSHSVSSFSPLELYENYGIRSYNIGSEQQSILVSYYWLKEALRYQKPKVVILDSYVLFKINDEALNVEESAIRKAIDCMKWSNIKVEAVKAICDNDKEQSALSYYMPNVRYHTRWENLDKNDFTYFESSRHEALMGYSALNGISGDAYNFQPFIIDSSIGEEQPHELMKIYLDNIVQLCEERDIQLILVKTPTIFTGAKQYNYMARYAKEHNLTYIDYNEETVYNDIDYKFSSDNADHGHLNVIGMKKITNHIGNLLITVYGINAQSDSQYDKLIDYYEMIKSKN